MITFGQCFPSGTARSRVSAPKDSANVMASVLLGCCVRPLPNHKYQPQLRFRVDVLGVLGFRAQGSRRSQKSPMSPPTAPQITNRSSKLHEGWAKGIAGTIDGHVGCDAAVSRLSLGIPAFARTSQLESACGSGAGRGGGRRRVLFKTRRKS